MHLLTSCMMFSNGAPIHNYEPALSNSMDCGGKINTEGSLYVCIFIDCIRIQNDIFDTFFHEKNHNTRKNQERKI